MFHVRYNAVLMHTLYAEIRGSLSLQHFVSTPLIQNVANVANGYNVATEWLIAIDACNEC